ncbi:hypothetical protein DFH06DRAFT_981537 [Mycena polygramma]|nr:hypothetical protein DFH06DRAFT_981537 [Mycena polygramma]
MEGTRECSKCHKPKELTSANWKAQFRGGGLRVTSNCRLCLENDRVKKQQRRNGTDPDKENASADASAKPDKDDASEFLGVNPISLDAFRAALEAAGDIKLFCARVDMSDLPAAGAEDVKEATDALAEIIWETIGYRFLYHSTQGYKDSEDCRYEYHCAQLESRAHKFKKNPDAAKQRDKGQMDMFECGGWLTIWASPEESDCYVRIRHLDCHQTYTCIDVPDELWKEILKTHPRPNFTQKSVYNHWLKIHQANYKRCDDEFESAKRLIQEFCTDPVHELESIPMPESDNFRALGFVFPSILRKWNGVVREVALDSTFQTNRAGFECFALLGEVSGSGVPLGFILLKRNNPGGPGLNAKEKYLRAAIRFITVVWHIRTKQVLSDKDIEEINALLAELPDDIKYQLCFWHSIRAVKTRLSVLGRHPAHYDVSEAFQEFDWIDRSFVPINQMEEELRTNIRALSVQLSNLINVQSQDRLQVAQTAIPTTTTHSVSSEDDSDDALQSYLDSLEEDDEEDLDEDPDTTDRWDGPASIFEPGETAFAASPTYVFCPAPHRKQLLRMFVRHFCEHSLLPDPRRGSDMMQFSRCTNSAYNGDSARFGATCGLRGTALRSTGSGRIPPNRNSSGAGAPRCLWRIFGATSSTKPCTITSILASINSFIS